MHTDIRVPYIDLVSQFSDADLRADILKVLDHCQFVHGPVVETFERHFAELCRTNFSIGVNSGTDAIFLALRALGVGPGDEVITVANSFIATVGAIVATGAKPVFVDVGRDYLIDPNKVETALTSHTRAIVPVHLTGRPAPMRAINALAEKHGLFVVEDAAQAIGASIADRLVGSLGHAGCFSLHPLKNLNVAGDGGVITTDSKSLCLKLKQMRNHGLRNRDMIENFGYNSRLDAIQAAVGTYNLRRLDDVTRRRTENAQRYDRNLSDLAPMLILPPKINDVHEVYHTYVVQVENRADLIESLLRSGIQTKIHYPVPIHLQPPCRAMGWKEGDLPITEAQSGKILSLPVHQFLTQDQIDYVSEMVRTFYSHRAIQCD